MFGAINIQLITLNLDRADNSAHHSHWHSHGRLRPQTIIRTDNNARTTAGCLHVVVSNDHFTSAHCSTVWTKRRYRHGRQLGNIELLTVSPSVTGSANVANWIVERYKKPIT